MSRQRSFRQQYSRVNIAICSLVVYMNFACKLDNLKICANQAGLVQASIQGLLSGQDDCVSVEQLLHLLKIAHGDRVRLRHKLVRVFCRILGRTTSAATADVTKNTSVPASASDDYWLLALAPLLAGYMEVPLPRANKSGGAEPASTLSLEELATVCAN